MDGIGVGIVKVDVDPGAVGVDEEAGLVCVVEASCARSLSPEESQFPRFLQGSTPQ